MHSIARLSTEKTVKADIRTTVAKVGKVLQTVSSLSIKSRGRGEKSGITGRTAAVASCDGWRLWADPVGAAQSTG